MTMTKFHLHSYYDEGDLSWLVALDIPMTTVEIGAMY